MLEIFNDIELIYLLVIFISGVISFSLLTVNDAGGVLVLIPFLNFIVETNTTAQ